MAEIVRIGRRTSHAVEQLALALQLDDHGRAELTATVHRLGSATAPAWSFLMLNDQSLRDLLPAIRKHCRRPNEALRVWTAALSSIQWGTGRIMASRTELAELADVDPSDVSRCLSDLAKLNVLTRERQGRSVTYRINGHTAWFGNEADRQRVAAEQGELVLDRAKPAK